MEKSLFSFKKQIWKRFGKNKIALMAFYFLIILSLIGVYAPVFASNKPLFVRFGDKSYFPLLRYLFFSGFYTKPIDLFFNVLMVTIPLFLVGWGICLRFFKGRGIKSLFIICGLFQVIFTIFCINGLVKDPERNLLFVKAREKTEKIFPDFDADINMYDDYQKLNLVVRYKLQKEQKERLLYLGEKMGQPMPLLYEWNQRREAEEREHLIKTVNDLEIDYIKKREEFPLLLKAYLPFSHQLTLASFALKEAKEDQMAERQLAYEMALAHEKKARLAIDEAEDVVYKYRYAKARILYLEKRAHWLKTESRKIGFWIRPLLRDFHWEEDAGGGQESNAKLPWWERTRLNRKDLAAALIFGVRVSLIVGFSAVFLSLIIGIPLGLFAGYFAGKVDIIVLRFIEIWEAMPTFFTLLLISAIFHNKSLFLTIIVLGLFGWTGFARFIRAESLRERNLAYVMASKSLGFKNMRIMYSDVLPNAISPVLALLPFSMMAAITSEAALAFLGLGEENSTSWGVLMSEARTVFPGESYLLWPPALLLTAFLVAIALVGDGLRDALDPKMQN